MVSRLSRLGLSRLPTLVNIWQNLIIKGPKKRSFEILHCLRWERNSYKKCRSDKIVFPHRFNIAKKSGFLSDLQNIILFAWSLKRSRSTSRSTLRHLKWCKERFLGPFIMRSCHIYLHTVKSSLIDRCCAQCFATTPPNFVCLYDFFYCFWLVHHGAL